MVVSVVLIFYCKKKIFKNNSSCNRNDILVNDKRNEESKMIDVNFETVQHQYANIDEDVAIKKFFDRKGLINNKLFQQTLSQTSITTNLTLTSVTRNNTNGEDFLKSLTNFTTYGKCCYGEVYLANSGFFKGYSRKNIGKKTVALKILRQIGHDQSIFEFHRDIETFSKLNHENIVKLIDICTDKEGQEPNIVILEHSSFVSRKKIASY
jgi:hypothetical protein